jgi:hypothetical protein
MRHRESQLDLNRAVEVGDGRVACSFELKGDASLGEVQRHLCVDLYRLVQIGDGPVELALAHPSSAAAVIRHVSAEFEPNRGREISDCAVVGLDIEQNDAASDEVAKTAGLELDGAVEVRNCLLALTLSFPRRPSGSIGFFAPTVRPQVEAGRPRLS